jgi:hypothetical protein
MGIKTTQLKSKGQLTKLFSNSFLFGDLDAYNVISAIEATRVSLSNTQRTAITNRIVSAKNDGVWSKLIAYYGYVGGTAAAHAINWKNPSLYNITWTGSFTHNSSGIKGNGTYPSATSYGNTGIAASSVLTTGNVGLGFYTTSTRANDINYDIGCYSPSPPRILTSYIYAGEYGYYGGGATNLAESGTYDSSKKYYSGSRIGTSIKSYKNGVVFASATDSDNALPTTNIYVCNLNFNGVGTAPSVCVYGSHCINTGLTDIEESANYISELAFQTALGRN